jgi:alkyl hydroperoxide reductase subunit AhpC
MFSASTAELVPVRGLETNKLSTQACIGVVPCSSDFTHADIPIPSLRLGSIAPNFQAETTQGPIDFHEFIGDKWVVLFSHPEDYTPVCTTELGAFAKLEPEFTKRGVKLIGLSANTIESHGGWIKDIDEISGSKLTFPIIGDKQRKVAYLYDM